ncbi:MAG: hypothetical protein K5761_06980 [Clostridiales bacterium]|nr:hypothetical protein [Clostridiales bacterium]
MIKILLIILAVILALFLLTFIIYITNSDMKLVRKIYDKSQSHYDKLEKDRKL